MIDLADTELGSKRWKIVNENPFFSSTIYIFTKESTLYMYFDLMSCITRNPSGEKLCLLLRLTDCYANAPLTRCYSFQVYCGETRHYRVKVMNSALHVCNTCIVGICPTSRSKIILLYLFCRREGFDTHI